MHPGLYGAATSGDVGFLEQEENAAKRTQLLFSTAPQENTALHIAARSGHAHFTRKILQLCSSRLLRMKNSNHDTALHCAVRADSDEIVEILLDEVEGESSSSIRLLRMQNMEGNTALHEALRNRHEDMAIRMVRADPKLALVVNNANESSFLLAAKEEMEEVVKEMLSMDAIIHTSSDDVIIPVTAPSQLTAEEMRELIKIKDNNGRTALHHAAMRNNAKIICMILKIDSHQVPYMVDNNGCSALHAAVAFGMQRSMLELLKHCPDTIEQFDTSGRNVLHIALLNRKFGIIRRLLELPYIGGLLNGLESDKEENVTIYLTSEEDSNSKAAAMRKENGQIVFAHESLHRDQLQPMLDEIQTEERHATKQLDQKLVNRFKNQHQVFVVVASLIATVTFAAAFTLPGGYRSSDEHEAGTAVLASKPTFKAFVLLDALAMSFSIFAIFCYMFTWGARVIKKINLAVILLYTGNFLTLIACFCMLFTLSAGVSLVVADENKLLAIAVLVICSLPPGVFLATLILRTWLDKALFGPASQLKLLHALTQN